MIAFRSNVAHADLLTVSLIALLTLNAVVRADEDNDLAVSDPRNTLSEQEFDQMVFGARQTLVVVNGQQRRAQIVDSKPPATEARSQMEKRLEVEISALQQRCSLTDEQKKKLRLAGRGDILNLLNRALELRQQCTATAMTQEEYAQFSLEIQRLRMIIGYGAVSDATLFHKTLRGLLTELQKEDYQTLQIERQKKMLEQTAAGFGRNNNIAQWSEASRTQFVEVMLKQAHLPKIQHPYCHIIVLLEAGRLEEQLKPVLNDAEWQALQIQINQAQRSAPHLRDSGIWPIEPNDDDELADAKKE